MCKNVRDTISDKDNGHLMEMIYQ